MLIWHARVVNMSVENIDLASLSARRLLPAVGLSGWGTKLNAGPCNHAPRRGTRLIKRSGAACNEGAGLPAGPGSRWPAGVAMPPRCYRNRRRRAPGQSLVPRFPRSGAMACRPRIRTRDVLPSSSAASCRIGRLMVPRLGEVAPGRRRRWPEVAPQLGADARPMTTAHPPSGMAGHCRASQSSRTCRNASMCSSTFSLRTRRPSDHWIGYVAVRRFRWVAPRASHAAISSSIASGGRGPW